MWRQHTKRKWQFLSEMDSYPWYQDLDIRSGWASLVGICRPITWGVRIGCSFHPYSCHQSVKCKGCREQKIKVRVIHVYIFFDPRPASKHPILSCVCSDRYSQHNQVQNLVNKVWAHIETGISTFYLPAHLLNYNSVHWKISESCSSVGYMIEFKSVPSLKIKIYEFFSLFKSICAYTLI